MLRITKDIHLPIWSASVSPVIIGFWEARGVTFDETSETRWYGRRGSLWGNMTSFDMARLRSELRITREGEASLLCVLDVNTLLQDITSWNEYQCQLEMDTFESVLLGGGELTSRWEEYEKRSLWAHFLWTISYGVQGRRVPRGWTSNTRVERVKRSSLRG